MSVIAKLKYLRIAPRKVRLVADLIRGKRAEEAKNILNFTVKKAALPILKLLKSCLANAKNDFQLEEGNLYIQKLLVDEGPKNKRWIARARGKADEIQKKTSHITIVLGEIKKEGVVAEKYVEKEEGVKKEGKGTERVEKALKTRKEKLRPGAKAPKPKKERRTKKVFRRTAF
ncbi:MAG: 50S ribosomal protein L22 [Candidatus Nealsonbacteria bacterium CG08_land_8_20_14_0_20_38_20]|uniref:Large ribosomal subunit protein uL22 n=1 Tax=Candidatus Nealsonbacteria bacterium CG08_land_8_20_14_0_20_38_20 TaxID=1974705 RepID=A0A2H0YLP6_9BACT|nr:MAG: 50S ribosomal protein L22 [Candidatus Nealsonbacteria bacterium CG08_land_8_20_14_0_20_38_20]